MSELRSILLGCALGVLALIWWWTARNSRQGRGGGPERESEPPVASVPAEKRPTGDWGVSPLEPLSIKTADFDRVPILEMPMMADIEAASGRGDPSIDFSHPAPPVLTQVAEPVPRPAPPPQIAPPPQPMEAHRPALAAAPGDDSDRFAPAPPRSANASEQQRIVTVRVCPVGDGRWSGAQLIAALESQGLAYGKYKVYHRRDVDGRSLFCVASLVEPGTFDMDLMPSQEFRGLTLFAVLPGPAEPVQTLDALLTTACGLAEDLTAMVQDAQGLPLSPLRAAALREDVARFQAQLA